MSNLPCDGKVPSWGQRVAKLIWEAKKRKTAAGELLMIADVAEIIDMADQARGPQMWVNGTPVEMFPIKTPETAIPFDSSHFGDRKVIPPLPEHVTAYSASIGYPLHGQAWCDSYAQKGWTVGKAKMKDWQAAVRNWKANDWAPLAMKAGKSEPRKYNKF